MFRGIKFGIAALLLSALAACGSLTGGELIRPGEPTGVIEVINGSSQTLTSVLISNCSAMSYGLNRLPGGTTIPPGYSYSFTVSAGCWDVGAGLAYHEAYNQFQVLPNQRLRWRVTD